MTNKLRSFSAVFAAAIAATAAAPANAETCTPRFVLTNTTYFSRICGMPDYDQRRKVGILMGDGRQFGLHVPLGRNGSCHCVPTSFANILGYYVGKGVKGDNPPKFDWDGRPGYVARPNVEPQNYLDGQMLSESEIDAHNDVTATIAALGPGVGTETKCGTSFGTVLGAWADLQEQMPAVWFTTTQVKPGYDAPRTVANVLAAGGTVAVGRGRYVNYTESGGVASWGEKAGGHAVTIQGVSGTAGAATFEVADPASNDDPVEAGDNDRYRQSAFARQARRLTLVRKDGTNEGRWRWGDVAADGDALILDSMLFVYPTVAVLADGHTIRLMPGVSFNAQGTDDEHPTAIDIPGELKSKAIDAGGAVLDAAFLPASGEVAYLTKGSRTIRAVAVGSRAKRVIGRAPRGAKLLEADPTGREIFASGGAELVRMGADGADVRRVRLASPLSALTFDPGRGLGGGRLLSITADRSLRRHAPATLAAGKPARIARSLLSGSGALAASVDPSGRLVLRRGTSRRVGLRGARSERRKLGALRGSGGLAVGDRSALLTVVGGRLTALSPTGKRIASSPFHGRPARGRLLQITRSGSDSPASEANRLIDERIVDPDFPEMAP